MAAVKGEVFGKIRTALAVVQSVADELREIWDDGDLMLTGTESQELLKKSQDIVAIMSSSVLPIAQEFEKLAKKRKKAIAKKS